MPASAAASSAARGSSDEIAAAAATEAPRGTSSTPASGDRRGGSGALAAAIVAGLVVAGALVAYDAFFRAGADTTVLEERIVAVESRAASAEETATAARARAEASPVAADLTEQIAALESRIDEVAQTADAAPAQDRIAALEERIAALATRLDEEIAPRLESLAADIGGVDAATQAADEARQAIAQAQADMQSLREGVAAEAQATRQAYLAITAANAIVSALPAGAPYAGAFETLQAAGMDEGVLADLAPFAESGAPTAEMLRARFAEVAPEVHRALTPEDPTQDGVGSFFEGLFARAVRVEPVDGLEAPGEPAIDPVADVVRALALGDLPAAYAAWQELPEAGRAASQDFADTLAARIAAGEAARAAVDAARGALAPQGQ